ncbi:MAG: hypothetical protein VR72_05850 [Clostridiaceae bacterium BRH_c20a]|nr:MAG: hypothetical protein VR72_05850 [Clostridiaceae bacterium BRH_c20a]
MEIVFLAIISHVIADFIFQTEEIVELKEQKGIKGYIYHGLGIFAASFVLLFSNDGIKDLILFLSLITIIHLIIDYIKVELEQGEFSNNKLFSIFNFIIDQVLHILLIIFLLSLLDLGKPIILEIVNIKFLFSILILIYLTFGGSILIRKTLDLIYRRKPNYLDIIENSTEEKDLLKEARVGKYIGILERTILFIVLINGKMEAVGFIIAAKSFTRFKQLEKKEFAEYYLIGTLLSVTFALISYVIYSSYELFNI